MRARLARVLVASLAVLVFVLGVQVVLGSGTITVDTLVDESDGSCVDGDCSLRDAIDVASPGDTVDFGVTGVITIASDWDPFEIEKDLTVSGPGINLLTISGDDRSGIFWVKSGYVVTISGMTLQDGYADGAAARSEGTLYLSDCLARYCWGGDGGAILNNGGVMYIDNCTILDSASPYGGGIDNLVGGLLYLTDSRVISNTADEWGGGLMNYEGTVVVRNSLFAGNVATRSGGAIWNKDVLVVEASTFLSNTAGYGAGLHNTDATARITNSTFAANHAVTRGGGIGNVSGSALTLTNNTIVSNTNYGVWTEGTGTKATAINTIIADNTAADCKGDFTSGGDFNMSTDGSCSLGFTQVSLAQLKFGSLKGDPPYFPLLEDSVAIDAGTNHKCPAMDQRGASRPQDPYLTGTPQCDVGSYEASPFRGIHMPLILRGF